MLGNEWELNVFSNLDSSKGGYPRSISFHQNRLIFGGSRDKPQTIFASGYDSLTFNHYTCCYRRQWFDYNYW